MQYAEWRACERFGIKPKGIGERWEDISPIHKCELIAYDQIRMIEEHKKDAELLSALFGASQ